jgi:mannosyltransferase OCH1-like enzyme
MDPDPKTSGIPKIFHQMWFDRVEYDNETGPAKYHEKMQTWRTHHPHFKFMFWNRRRIEKLWEHPHLQRWKQFFYSLEVHIEKCDFTRYAILYLYGGVYADLDFVCLKNILPLLHNREFGWAFETISHNWPSDPRFRKVFNGFLFSIPGHWVWEKLMDNIVKHYARLIDNWDWSRVIVNTGPLRLGEFVYQNKLYQHRPDLFIDTCAIMPIDFSQEICPECQPNARETAYCMTYWNEGTGWQEKK